MSKSFEEVMERFRAITFNGNFDLMVAIANGGIIPSAILNKKLNLDLQLLKINLRDVNQIPKCDSPILLYPMPVFTFFESYDFSGKRIIPFCSHGNGMLGETIANICKACPGADVREALSVTYGGGSSLQNDIREWLNKHSLMKQ